MRKRREWEAIYSAVVESIHPAVRLA